MQLVEPMDFVTTRKMVMTVLTYTAAMQNAVIVMWVDIKVVAALLKVEVVDAFQLLQQLILPMGN